MKIKRRPDLAVVVAGHICLDIFPKFSGAVKSNPHELFLPGQLLKVGDAVLATGGAVSNAGIALHKLGCKAHCMASIGSDEFGSIIREKMQAYSGAAGFHTGKQEGSSYSVILAPPGVDRIICHHSGCNDHFTAAQINWEIVENSRHFHLGYPPIMRALYRNEGREMVEMFEKARSCGVSTSLDMALPDPESEAGRINWRTWLENVLPFVDFFMPSIEEMLLFLDRADWHKLRNGQGDVVARIEPDTYRRLAAICLELGCGVVLLKGGHRGMYLKSAGGERIACIPTLAENRLSNWQDRELWGAAFEPPGSGSAAGAGDAAVAGFIAAVLRSRSVEKSLQISNCLGYQNLRAIDTISGVGTYAETLELLTVLHPIACEFLPREWEKTPFKGVWQYSGGCNT